MFRIESDSLEYLIFFESGIRLLQNTCCQTPNNAPNNAHTHDTRRSSYNFHLSRELSVSPNGFSFTAIKQWNQLPNSLKSIDNQKIFKTKLQQFLLAQYGWFYCVIIWRILLGIDISILHDNFMMEWLQKSTERYKNLFFKSLFIFIWLIR